MKLNQTYKLVSVNNAFQSIAQGLFRFLNFKICLFFLIISNFSLAQQNKTKVIYSNTNNLWEIYWEQLIEPGNFENHPEYELINVPGYWNKLNHSYSAKGYCTYRKVIKNNYSEKTLGIRIYKIHSAYKLFVNGVKVIEKGKVGTNKETTIPKNSTDLLPFTNNFQDIEIVLQIANFNHKNGGIAKQIDIGPFDDLQLEFTQNIVYGLIIFGFIFFMAAMHLLLFYFHKTRMEYLYFGLFCLFISFQEFFASDDLFVFIFPETSWNLSYKLEYLILYISLPLFAEFALHTFRKDFSKKIIRFIVILSIFFIVLVVSTTPIIFTKSLVFFEIFTLISITYIVYMVYISYQKKRSGSLLMLIAFVIVGIASISHIIANEFAFEKIEPIPIGVSFFILFQAILLARNSSKAYYKLKIQAAELVDHRNHLQEMVSARTREIENQKEEITAQNEKLNQQHQKLLTQSAEITDSITYAKNIQTAALPTEKYIKSLFPESFIFYRPKDIVSGDFYWIKKVNEFIIVACADCTGHGVPGAFMSMLGISILNDLVYKKEITQANHVLNEMRNYLKESLHQTKFETSVKDGMDISLLAINTQKKVLQYAGAFSSMVFIQNNNVKIIKGNNMPVGIYVKEEQSFTNHILNYSPNDQIYLFTDGYPDQFGGRDKKKFLTKNLIQLITDNHNKPLSSQKEVLQNTMDLWMYGQEQIDDMLVIGIKVT